MNTTNFLKQALTVRCYRANKPGCHSKKLHLNSQGASCVIQWLSNLNSQPHEYSCEIAKQVAKQSKDVTPLCLVQGWQRWKRMEIKKGAASDFVTSRGSWVMLLTSACCGPQHRAPWDIHMAHSPSSAETFKAFLAKGQTFVPSQKAWPEVFP